MTENAVRQPLGASLKRPTRRSRLDLARCPTGGDERWAAYKDFEVAEWHVDEFWSEGTHERPGLERAMEHRRSLLRLRASRLRGRDLINHPEAVERPRVANEGDELSEDVDQFLNKVHRHQLVVMGA